MKHTGEVTHGLLRPPVGCNTNAGRAEGARGLESSRTRAPSANTLREAKLWLAEPRQGHGLDF